MCRVPKASAVICAAPRALLGIGVGTSWSPAVYIFYTDLSGEERLTDAGLVYRAQQGDAAAWEELVRTHQGTIFRFAYLLVGDADDAEDIAQETFIRAFHALSSFDTTRSLRPWLLRIAANLAQNRRRAAGRYLAALRRAFHSRPTRRRSLSSKSTAANARKPRRCGRPSAACRRPTRR